MSQQVVTPQAVAAGHELFAQSRFVWAGRETWGRNQFASFIRDIDYRCSYGACVLHVFADTRYRLFVNERFMAYGPGRFVTQHPEYDSFDLAPLLAEGRNRIRVEVNFYGASSFQSMPDGKPGFIADGGTAGGEIALSTPGKWLCLRHRAWEAQAPLFSFAQNPVEICDTRILQQELAQAEWGAPHQLGAADCPWGALRPRSTGYPDYAPLRPQSLSVAGALRNGKRLLAIQTCIPNFHGGGSDWRRRHWRRMLTWVYAPRAHAMDLDCLWMDLELNGKPVARRGSTPFGNHELATLQLSEGWNLLAARFQVLSEHWTVLLGYPLEENISWHARPDRGEATPFLVSPLEVDPLPLPAHAGPRQFVAPQGWTGESGDPNLATPARQVAWDEFNEDTVVRKLPMSRFAEVAALDGQSVSWCFDFGDEYYGHPLIDLEAPAGTILDIAYDDWMREDGATSLYSSNPFTDAADRFILRGGRQRIQVCNPRGGIYLQVTLRGPSGQGSFKLHDLSVLSRRHLNHPVETFRCDDPVFTWAWEKSLHTLSACTDESYADCPWRERGSYIGDSYVNLHIHRLLTADYSVARRSLRIFGEAQMDNGQLLGVAPSWHRIPHEDYTLIWMLCLRDYWAFTGDASLLAEMWEHIVRIWQSPTWERGPLGLWDATTTRIFLDWGKLDEETRGEANAALNLFRLGALEATAEIAAVLGRIEAADAYRAEAAAVRAAIEKHLWKEKEGRFIASLGAETPAVHANVLALRFGAGDPQRILGYLEPLLRRNFRHGLDNGQASGYLELYFFIFLLPALAAHGRHGLAEELLKEHYGFLKELGYQTLSECFARIYRHIGSRCHSWSGAAAAYMAEHVLGLRQRRPGDLGHWLLEPVTGSVASASGSMPHPRGSIAVEWRRSGSRILAKVRAPAGVSVQPAAGVELL